MSVIRADTVGPSAGGTTRSLVRGTAAAWVNFNGTGTIAARDSENVSSLTDNGTGRYLVNYTSNMANGNYSVVTDNGGSTFNDVNSCLGNLGENPSVSASNHSVVVRSGASFFDEVIVTSIVMGELA